MNNKQVFGQGEIPSEWDVGTLYDLGEVVTGTTPRTENSQYYGGEFLFIKPSDLNGITYIMDSETKLSELGFKQTRILPKKTVMVTCIGSIGKMGIAGTELATNQQINSIICHKKIIPEYLFYNLKYRQKFLENYANKSLLPIINKSDFSKIQVPVPPLVEQRGIVEVLGTVDECILLTDDIIERAEKLKRGLMQRLLTRGIGHTEYKQTPLGEIPKKWKINKIENLIDEKTIIKIQDGNHGEQHPKSSEFVNEGIPFIMANNIENGNINLKNCNFLTKERADKLRIGFSKEKDILLTHKGSIGLTAIVPRLETDYIMLTPQITYYRINWNILDGVFLHYVFQTDYFQKALKRMSKQSTRDYISLKNQKKLSIILPDSIKEQKQISSILQMIDEKIKQERMQKDKFIEMKQGLMQVLITGKVRVELREDGLHRIGNS